MRLHMFIQGRCSEAKTFYSSMLTMCWVNVDSVCRNAKTSAAAGKRHQRWVSKQPTELVSRNWTKWSAVISCKDSLQYGGCNHYCGTFKVRVFQKSGEERISCTLAGRQGAMSALIRSACSARTDICGLWTLHNRCLSYSVLLIQHVHLIHPWGGTICIQRMHYRY